MRNGGSCLNPALHIGVLGNERDRSRFGVFVAITRKHQMNSSQAMCAALCMHECVHGGHIWMCEQVAGIFEDDSRGLTHARPNKAAL